MKKLIGMIMVIMIFALSVGVAEADSPKKNRKTECWAYKNVKHKFDYSKRTKNNKYKFHKKMKR